MIRTCFPVTERKKRVKFSSKYFFYYPTSFSLDIYENKLRANYTSGAWGLALSWPL